MLAFQQYQRAFTAHLRDPKHNPKPAKVADKRMAIYREIVFNNIVGTVSACFPVCQQVLGKRTWLRLCRAFFAHHAATSPLFREIPAAFLSFLQSPQAATFNLPLFLSSLAHYEWAELHVSNLPETTPTLSHTADLLNEQPIMTNAHALLEYDYPVHTIGKRHQPSEISPTHMLMFRNEAFNVKFIVLNAITFSLLQRLKQQPLTGQQALEQIAIDLNHPQPEVIIQFGLGILEELMQQGAIAGTRAL